MTTPSIPSPASDLKTPQSVGRFPWWVSLVVILGALLTLTSAVISKVDPTLLTNGNPMTVSARILCRLYVCTRSSARCDASPGREGTTDVGRVHSADRPHSMC